MRFAKYVVPLLMMLIFITMISGCAAGPNIAESTPSPDETVAGFWLGLWHGLICPITFIISLFSDSVHFYEVHNNGGWYNAGYALGVIAILGGGGNRTRTVIRRERVYVDSE